MEDVLNLTMKQTSQTPAQPTAQEKQLNAVLLI
jgi:hypothetical protein